jgi:hypothetical protein
MHADTRTAIIALARCCTSCETLAVTNAKDETVERLLVELNYKVSKAGRRWSYCSSFRVSMMGSGERKTVWIFIRPPCREDEGTPGFRHVADVNRDRVGPQDGFEGLPVQVAAKKLKRKRAASP